MTLPKRPASFSVGTYSEPSFYGGPYFVVDTAIARAKQIVDEYVAVWEIGPPNVIRGTVTKIGFRWAVKCERCAGLGNVDVVKGGKVISRLGQACRRCLQRGWHTEELMG